jgi:hypothetical protein
MTLGAAVLAHGGGAPEAATIVVPLIIVIAFVVRERKSVRRLRELEERGGSTSVDSDPEAP